MQISSYFLAGVGAPKPRFSKNDRWILMSVPKNWPLPQSRFTTHSLVERSIQINWNALGFFYEANSSYKSSGYMGMAHILVGLKLSEALADSISIQLGQNTFHHNLDYEGNPFRCGKCHTYGRLYKECRRAQKKKIWVKKSDISTQVSPSKSTSSLDERNSPSSQANPIMDIGRDNATRDIKISPSSEAGAGISLGKSNSLFDFPHVLMLSCSSMDPSPHHSQISFLAKPQTSYVVFAVSLDYRLLLSSLFPHAPELPPLPPRPPLLPPPPSRKTIPSLLPFWVLSNTTCTLNSNQLPPS
jgi:hypothetical protein